MELRKLMGEIGSRAWGVGRVLVVVGGVMIGASGAGGVLVDILEESAVPDDDSRVRTAPKRKGEIDAIRRARGSGSPGWETRLGEYLNQLVWELRRPQHQNKRGEEQER